MSIFKKLFGAGTAADTEENPRKNKSFNHKKEIKTLTFGRYTDCNKDAEQLAHWNRAIKAFGEKDYLTASSAFLKYIKDDHVKNVEITESGEEVTFSLIQGSKKITGKANRERFVAEAEIAAMNTPSIPVMRKLMSINFGLRYSKFALNDNVLCMRFSSHAIDASPNKLYAGLRELAKKADQQDDLLLAEFSGLEEVGTDHILPVSDQYQAIKYRYLKKWIEETLTRVGELDSHTLSGGIAFLLLNLTYKIDYLICPQGKLTDQLEQIQALFFEKTDASTTDRNQRIIEKFKSLLSLPEEEVMAGIYQVKATFGIANSASHKTVMDMMFKEREKVGWYRDNGYRDIEEAVYSYMVSYAFFNYGMIYPLTDMLNLLMQAFNPDFYAEMGDENQVCKADGSLDEAAIKKRIRHIVQRAQLEYPKLQVDEKQLKFYSPSALTDSLLLEIDKWNLTKV